MPNANDCLWAITCYYNPLEYRRRLANYRAFRSRLAVPLIALELAGGHDWHLRPDDADVLIQLRGDDTIWQKERLLNIALEQISSKCQYVAWLDCDVVFPSDRWIARTCELLERHKLVQLFEDVYDLPADCEPDDGGLESSRFAAHSIACKVARGTVHDDDFRTAGSRYLRGTACGVAWAGHREVLQRHGLYDACILGGGDRAIVCAAYGRFDDGITALKFNSKRGEHYRHWARPFYETVAGNVGYVDETVYHLWHGKYDDRGPGTRELKFAKFAFDPFRDVELDQSRCWRWNSEKPDMHAFVKGYFQSRKEDG